MEKYYTVNKRRWSELVDIHAKSDEYDLDGFIAGKNSLHSIELEALGDVSGKSLLHLQCHFGLDTLSWARLGAKVTGVDFNEPAVELAREIAKRIGVDAEFIFSNVYDLPKRLDAEFHPFMWVFDEEHPSELEIKYGYWQGEEPDYYESEGTYADKDAKVENRGMYNGAHPLSEVVNALIDAGLTIRELGEYPFSFDGTQMAFMETGEDGYSRLPGYDLPLMYSLKATK